MRGEMMVGFKVVVAAVGVTLAAATSVAGQAVVSLQGGLVRAALSGSEAKHVDPHLGLHAGVSLGVPLAVSVAPGLGFRVGGALTQRGGAMDAPTPAGFGSDPPGRVDVSIDFLQIPLLLSYRPAFEGRVAPHAFGGVAPSFRVACSYEEGPFDSCDESVYLRSTYVEWLAGAGVSVRRGRGTVTLDVSFSQGLSSIYESGGGVKTRSLTVTAGAEFPLHRQ